MRYLSMYLSRSVSEISRQYGSMVLVVFWSNNQFWGAAYNTYIIHADMT